MSQLPFDPSDPEALRRWLVELNVALDDVGAIAEDMLRPTRKRELGPVKHRELYEDGWGKIMSLLGRSAPPPGAPDSNDSDKH
ncbi:Hypothetical protein A7982_10036 [Minicystis rosea]|nr:Hypothetical protein A7982_10036 [Minicystis rosea]